MNHKKLYRLHTDERLAVRKRKKRKRAMGSRTPMRAKRLRQTRAGAAVGWPGSATADPAARYRR